MSEKKEKTYKIVRLESENVKRLKAVAIEPNGNVIEISGKNGNGKSSILDSIYYALTGTSEIAAVPIRRGEEKARVTLDLGSLTITRRFNAQEDGSYTTTLVVESEEGARFQKPQQILDSLVGSLTMDPLEFTRMKPKDQFDALRRFVPDFDFDAAATANKEDFSARTDINRRVKEAQAQADGIVVAEDTPDEPIDESALVDELQRAGEHNAAIEQRKAKRDSVATEIVSLRETVKKFEADADELRRRAAEIDAKAVEYERNAAELEDKLANAGALPDPIDPSDIRAKIEEARMINAAVSRKKQRATLVATAKKLKAESDGLTKSIADRDAAKQKAIAAAKMPVDGIGFGDGMVLLNGLPFDQASSAEQLRASIALAMAANPRLRIILVRDGSLLDDQSWAILVELANKYDVQIWAETVDSDRSSAIVIEDGSIKSGEAILEAAE